MTPELKAKWLADLKSGKYPKTKGHLKDETGYCCLGVLLETIGVGFEDGIVEPDDDGRATYEPHQLEGADVHCGNELSYHGLQIVGLGDQEQNDLVGINDENTTFAEVIAYIEAKL